MIPDIYTTEVTNKGLTTLKPSFKRILFLPKHHDATTTDHVTNTKA